VCESAGFVVNVLILSCILVDAVVVLIVMS
jgi:hypothetical protein